MMTEDEAKTKWCPFARVVACQPDGGTITGSPTGYNRGTTGASNDIPASRCIASACMAWRWLEDGIDGIPVYERKPTPGVPGHFDNSPVGYCGLAGRP